MSQSWENAKKRLSELQKRLPTPLHIELTYKDGSKEILTLEEVLKKDNDEWELFKVVKGTDIREVREFLDWLCPDTVINY